MSRGRITLVAVLAGFLLPACGGGGAEEPQRVGESGGLATYEVSGAGFSVGVPPDWQTVSVDDAFTESQLEAMKEDDPALAPYLDALGGPDSYVKLLALDPDIEAGFATNLNVIVEPVELEITREQYFEATMAQVRQVFDTEFEEARVDLPAGKALHLSYEQFQDPSGGSVATVQYILFEDGNGYVLTYSTLPDRVAASAAEFESSARSFALLSR
ncbi:MAG: hypothetical protein ACRDNR_16750 [Gaiellaceae bacterium]